MSRLTKYDEDSKQYVLLDQSTDLSELIQALGKLEDFKEENEFKSFGEYLRYLRVVRLKLSKKEFINLTGYSNVTIWKYENNENQPKRDFLQVLITKCNVPEGEVRRYYRKFFLNYDDEQLDSLVSKYISIRVSGNFGARQIQNMYDEMIGELIRHERSFLGLTMEQLGIEVAKAGRVRNGVFSRETISKMERGKLSIEPYLLPRFAKALKSEKLKEIADRELRAIHKIE